MAEPGFQGFQGSDEVEGKRSSLVDAKGPLQVGRRPAPDEAADASDDADVHAARRRAVVLGSVAVIVVIAVVIALVVSLGAQSTL